MPQGFFWAPGETTARIARKWCGFSADELRAVIRDYARNKLALGGSRYDLALRLVREGAGSRLWHRWETVRRAG